MEIDALISPSSTSKFLVISDAESQKLPCFEDSHLVSSENRSPRVFCVGILKNKSRVFTRLLIWLGDRDSNPGCLGQNQVSYH